MHSEPIISQAPYDGPLVSVVVPTSNSARTIGLCLSSIFGQTHSRIEAIVVDQRSKDETVSIVRTFPARLVTVPSGRTYLPPTKSRNVGAAKCSGEYLLHLDSDMELTPRVIESCVNASANGTKAVVIPEIDAYNNYWGECKALERSCYLGDPNQETPRFYAKGLFESLGGYDESLNAGEDWDIRIRVENARIPIVRTTDYLRHHIEGFNFFGNLRKKFHYARSFAEYRRKHPQASRETLTLIRPGFWHNRKRLARDPLHAVGLGLQKISEAYCTALGMLFPIQRQDSAPLEGGRFEGSALEANEATHPWTRRN
ncbi:MAG TPA: glycosyltransferase [Candidatus Angelobacter sp.]|nr:glycosyltransferase [Candidatus Angelobacter sp.]